jgi:hypothetical protein
VAHVVPLVAIGLGLRILAAGPGTTDGTPIAASVGAIVKLVHHEEPREARPELIALPA